MSNKIVLQKNDEISAVLDALKDDISKRQKCGLPFIIASIVLWTLISVVIGLDVEIRAKNIMIFCCSCPLMPAACLVGKIINVDIFDKENPLWKLGFIFTMNQLLYILIVMWAYSASPEMMVMIYAMVFGAHLLPYFWLYNTKVYLISSIVVTVGSLVIAVCFSTQAMTIFIALYELIFATILWLQIRKKFTW